MHNIKLKLDFVIGLENIGFAATWAYTFQPRNFTSLGSGGVKPAWKRIWQIAGAFSLQKNWAWSATSCPRSPTWGQPSVPSTVRSEPCCIQCACSLGTVHTRWVVSWCACCWRRGSTQQLWTFCRRRLWTTWPRTVPSAPCCWNHPVSTQLRVWLNSWGVKLKLHLSKYQQDWSSNNNNTVLFYVPISPKTET